MARSDDTRFRRSPDVVCYWKAGRFVLENYLTRVRIAASPLACALLDLFDDWRPAKVVSGLLGRYTPASIERAIGDLARHSFLQRSDGRGGRKTRGDAAWQTWAPAASLLHFSTKDLDYLTESGLTGRLLQTRARGARGVLAPKRYRGARKITLPKPAIRGELPRVLLARRTCREFSRRPVELESLATLLGLTWGVQQWIEVRGVGRLALKTSPSGGALHPIEVYVLSLRVKGLSRGLYHYAADRHVLELIRPGGNAREAQRFLAGQHWFRDAAAVMFMTAVFPRVWWKYKTARAYRVVLCDAGHLCQTFCLVATWLSLAPFCTMALADSAIERALGVDGVNESVVYAAGVGVRPERDRNTALRGDGAAGRTQTS